MKPCKRHQNGGAHSPIRFPLHILGRLRPAVPTLALSLFFIQQTDASLTLDERTAIEQELNAPITLDLKNRQSISGNPIKLTKDEIQLASADGAGEIIFTFSYDQIKKIEVPGESYKSLAIEWMGTGEAEKALDLMDLLYQQRNALLHILPASESNFFVLYIQLILDSPDPTRAIGVSTRLQPQIKNPAAIKALDNAILESYQRLELFEEALPLAKAAVAKNEPYGKSALGYYVLGSDLLRRAEYEAALDLALQPIVFSSLIPTEKLAHCYALAISAAYELRARDHATLLYKEMKTRGFGWPEKDSTLKPYLEKIEKYITDHDAN